MLSGCPSLAMPNTLRLFSKHFSRRTFSIVHSPQGRPYRINVGLSFAGKPPDLSTVMKKRARKTREFPRDGDIVRWRADMLSWEKNIPTTDAGEDFFYVQEMRNHSGLSLGVADGVGGWTDVGVDPSLFSQALMYHAARYSKQAWAGEPEIDPLETYEEREQIQGWELTPKECMELAYGGVLRERTVDAGSSTACIVSINSSNGLLRAANLGDSGFSIFRSSSILHVQKPQAHLFNYPKQISKMPAFERRYRPTITDSPREADTYETTLRDGDIVMIFTDGLSDNVFPQEMLQICTIMSRANGTDQEKVQDMADKLVQYARMCMMNEKRVSPFELAAAQAGLDCRGGKVDDVTVLIAMIRETI